MNTKRLLLLLTTSLVLGISLIYKDPQPVQAKCRNGFICNIKKSIPTVNEILKPTTVNRRSVPPATPPISTLEIPDGYEMRNGDWSNFPRPVVSKDFSETERNIIWESLGIAKTRIESSQVKSCIKKYVIKDYDGSYPQDMVTSMGLWASAHPTLRPKLGRKLTDDYTGGLQYLYISKIDIPKAPDGGYTLGRATLNIGVDKNDLKVNLNSVALTNFDTDTIAGTIIHEMLHNWGYDHSRSNSIDVLKKEVPGNFVYEAGWCVTRNGSEKTPGNFGIIDSPNGSVGGEVFHE